MSDIEKIIKKVLSDEKIVNSKNFRNKIYDDEPILKRASQIKKTESKTETPQKIKQMKEIAYTPEAYWKTKEWLFFQQGSFMADYTDNFDYEQIFYNTKPTYKDFNTDQLRGYFSWRKKLRNGEFCHAPLPFIYLYAFEIINNIGIESPEKGFELIELLIEHYGKISDDLKNNLSNWLSDYAVYNRMSGEFLERCPRFSDDLYLIQLIHYDKISDNELFSSLLALSHYNLESSKFYNEKKTEYCELTTRIFRKLSNYYQLNMPNSFFNYFFDNMVETPYTMFSYSVFYKKFNTIDIEIEISEVRSYKCQNGNWSCIKYTNNRKIGDFLKYIDKSMRKEYNYKYKLKKEIPIAKEIETFIKKEISFFIEEKRKREIEVKIDISQLSAIRADAEITKNALLTEADLAELDAEYPEPPEEPAADASVSENTLFTDAELSFLQELSSGGDWKKAARKYGVLPSILADSINEKLYDVFADTVIDFNGDMPELIEDYTDDIQKLLENGEI